MGSWAADTGAREGEEIALRGLSSGEVHVQCIPASTAAGAKAAGSLSPAPAAAEADRGGRGSKRGSREPQASEAAAKLVAAPAAGGGGRGSRHASREPQASEAAAKQAAPPAAGGGRGSQQASREPQASEAAAKQAAAPAAGGGGRGRGGKRASREPQQKHGGAAAAGDAEHFFASGGTSPEKGWQLGADGWWRRALTASACGNTKRGKGNIKLGFPGVCPMRLIRALIMHVRHVPSMAVRVHAHCLSSRMALGCTGGQLHRKHRIAFDWRAPAALPTDLLLQRSFSTS